MTDAEADQRQEHTETELPTVALVGDPTCARDVRRGWRAGVAAPWMTDNLEILYVLQREFYGPRTPLQSLQLAFRTVDRVAVPRENAAMRR